MRLSIEFRRKDLLWISPDPITNPLTGEAISLPIHLSDTVSIGPNVLDVMKQEIIEIEEESEITAPDGSKHITKNLVKKRVWQLRPPSEFFALEEEDTAVKQPDSIKDATTSPDGLYHIFQNPSNPLRKSFCTGGTVQGEEGDFLAVTKRSSVSINALVYRLAIGMTGSSLAASQYIGTIAADAWERDLIRAVGLYTLIAQTPGGFLPDHLVPTALKAGSSVGQTVENAVLRDACNWLGIDPDAPINRRQGRPRQSSKQNSAGEATSAGQFIELTQAIGRDCNGSADCRFPRGFQWHQPCHPHLNQTRFHAGSAARGGISLRCGFARSLS